MLNKEIKTPLIIGLILYGFALVISLLCVLLQNDIYAFWGVYNIGAELKSPIFPLITMYQIFVTLLYALFTLIILKYKGSSRRIVGIVLTVAYCIVSIAYPFVIIAVKYFMAQIQIASEVAASTVLESAVSFYTAPFITVSTVLMFIAIGRYGITKPENTDNIDKEVQTND